MSISNVVHFLTLCQCFSVQELLSLRLVFLSHVSNLIANNILHIMMTFLATNSCLYIFRYRGQVTAHHLIAVCL